MKVPFVDLGGLHAPMRAELERAIAAVLDDSEFLLGRTVTAFETAFAAAVGRRHGVGVASGTAALQLALLGAGVRPGDEVVTTPLTWISTALAISHCAARPIFADVDEKTGNLDPQNVERAITAKTRAILPVDLYGNPADLRALEEISARSGVVLVDDACQAHGARLDGLPVGMFGLAAAFSFYPAKNLGAVGDAGMVVTDDDEVVHRMRVFRDHGQDGRHHHVELGFNHRMDAIQAAVLTAKVPSLAAWNAQRRAAAARYDDLVGALPDVRRPAATPSAEPNWHLYVVRVPARDAVAQRMRAAGVEVAVHYPVPVHLQPAYAHLGQGRGTAPRAERFAAECLSLPMFPGITPDQQEVVVRTLAMALHEVT